MTLQEAKNAMDMGHTISSKRFPNQNGRLYRKNGEYVYDRVDKPGWHPTKSNSSMSIHFEPFYIVKKAEPLKIYKIKS